MTRPHLKRTQTVFPTMRPWGESGYDPKTCQYIATDKRRFTDADKCGKPVHDGGVYCKPHRDLCYSYRPSAEPNSFREVGSVGLAVGRPR